MDLLLAPRSYSSSEGEDDAERSVDSSETTHAPSVEDDDEDLSAASAVMAMGQSKHKRRSDSIDDLELSVESLRFLAQRRGLDTTALGNWSVRDDGKLLDPEQHNLHAPDAWRDPREDMYYLAILRRKLAELELPLVDGPISVMSLGSVVPEEHFYTSKKLFPIGYETLVKVQMTKPLTVAFRLRCKIVHGNKKKSPIFVVELENSAVEIVFRSYVASKAWKKALSAESVFTVETDDNGQPVDVLTPASGEDGFGLLRRNITRVLEGCIKCSGAGIIIKDVLKTQSAFSKDAINRLLSQEILLEEHCRDSEEEQRLQQQKEKEQREADKRSVREAARKLLEIEMKAQEDAKEAHRRAKEERKNAILEAKMEAARQKEARKEALRLPERRRNDCAKKKRKSNKIEEKENSMKRRIEELRQRRQMREEQKAILENGVVTSSSLGGLVTQGRGKLPPIPSLLSSSTNEVEGEVWARVKARYTQKLRSGHALSEEKHSDHDPAASEDTKFPSQVISAAVELDPLTALPSLGVFVNMMTLSDGSSPVGDGDLDDDSVGTIFASLHAELLKALVSEYFPLLQMGNTLEEFHRTRPMNAFSWPELARQVCQLAMEFKHPSPDEQLLKSIKGSKSYRDDAVTQPLRQKLYRRGTNLLKGVQFEEEKEEVEPETPSLPAKISVTLASEANSASAVSSDYYGVVLVGGASSKIKVGEKDQHLVVTEVVATSNDTAADKEKVSDGAVAEAKNDNADRIRIGDYLMCINGQDVREMSLDDFNSLVSGLKTPHGLLMSSVVPAVKNPMKHIATTQGATKMKCCGFVLKLLRAKEIAAPFNQPVDAELYPDYYSSGDIPEPMDLGTISEKIEDEDYEHDDVESFVDDVQLVWRNCYTYNSLKAEISNLAQKLSVIFERLMKEWVHTPVNRPMIAAEEDSCRNCQTIHAKGRLLLCDRCDAPYHTFCLESPLLVVPKSEWFCPTCLADPSFSPEQFQKKARDMAADSSGNSGSSELKDTALTELEKRLLSAIDLLSQENYSKLAVSDRMKVLRVLCELLEETSAVQSVYHSLEAKASDARKKLDESLADLQREWDRFSPPRSSHGVEQTKKFIVDGVEHELTDELLTAKKKVRGETSTIKKEPKPLITEEEDEDSSDNSEAGEEMIFEEFGDRFLSLSNEVTVEDGSGAVLSRPLCAFCGLEDGVLNGSLLYCKQSPLTAQTTMLNQYEVPEFLTGENADMLVVRTLGVNDLATAILEDTAEGVQYSDRSAQGEVGSQHESDGVKGIVYAVNDRVVFGMSRAAVQEQLRTAAQPILLYLTSLPGEAVRASVSIVKCHGLSMGLTLASHESFIFVQSYHTSEVGFGELSGQVFPGDALLMVNGVTTREKDIAEVEALLRVDNPSDVTYAVFVRQPSTQMRKATEEWQRTVHDVPSQRARESTFRAGLIIPQASGSTSYDVIFQDGPLGLALALEPRGVVVKSLNDHPDGTLGQASLSGRILRGDLVEQVNGAAYGQLTDLSQFTSWLLSLQRPLKITFSRQPPTGTNQSVTPQQANKLMTELVANSSLLCKQLKLPSSSDVKTFRVESFPLPFEAQNLLESIGVIATNGLVYCEQPPDSQDSAPLTVAVGDLIVGLNGKSVAGLSWAAVQALCAEMASTCAVYLHFTPFLRPMTLLQAHECCVESANVAWSECGSMLPRVEKARELESFIKWLIIPRTLAFGKCRHGYSFYRFFSDHHRLFVLSPDKKWSVCATREQLMQLLAYLEEDSRDSKIATRIKWCFHWILHDEGARLQLQQGLSCCEYSSKDFLREGPFSVEKEVLLAMDGDMEKYEALVGYNGRKFFLGSFYTQQEAENALQHKAMMNNVDAARSGMYQAGMPQVAMPGMQGDLQSSAYAAAQARYQEALKRKYTQTEDPYARQIADQMKRTRYADPTAAARMQQQFGGASNPVSFKRSLQALVDQGRAMLAAWNQFAASATVQTTNGLAYACLSSFEEVKKVVSRIVVDPTATPPDPKTFVCLHHAFVMGLICAMATQALTTSQKTPSDSALVKQVADAFATSILSCVDPSNMLRARALSGFATAAKKCEPSQRAGDLSVELHNVANFVLMFLRTTRYLSGTSFDDLSNCRPLFTVSTPGVESLPASFVQQVHLLENIRQAFYRKINMTSSGSIPAANQPINAMPAAPFGITPGSSMAMQKSNTQTTQASNDGSLVDVEFGLGPLGVVINYSNRGTIIVTEFSNDNNNMMGQAQASGKVEVGDEVYAVNGQRLEAIGMEGFKGAVSTGKRPLRVTFRKLLSTARGVTSNVPAQNTASNMAFPLSGAPQNTMPAPLAQVSSAMNQQVQQPNAFPQQAPTMNNNGVYGNQPGSGLMGMGASNVTAGGNYQNPAPGQFPGMGDGMNMFPFPAPSSQPMVDPSSQFNNPPMPGNMPGFMGDMSAQAFPAAPMGGQNFNSLPKSTALLLFQVLSRREVGKPFPPIPAQNGMSMNGGGNVMPMDPMPIMPNASSAMGFTSAPPPSSGAPNSFPSNNSTGEYVNFVAGNDPQLPQGDPSQVNYYDANGTTYRAAGDFEIDTSAIVSTELTAPESAEASAIADVDTEPESPSISQVTTPAQSDTDGERSEADRQRDRAEQLARLTLASNALQNSCSEVSLDFMPAPTAQAEPTPAEASTASVAPAAVQVSTEPPAEPGIPEGKPPLQTTRSSPRAQTGGKELRLTEETASRRSSRVSRKITNIADMYDPDFIKTHSKGAGSGSEAGMDEPTDGEIGELSTELLEGFSATIRPLKKTSHARCYCFELNCYRWSLQFHAMLFATGGGDVLDGVRVRKIGSLMEAVVFLEANIDPEWLDPGWKASPLPSAKNAIATATIASAAMRLYSLDDAISYGRLKRGGKRKQRNHRPGIKASESVSNPSELPFVGRLSTGLVALANKMINSILEAQRERSSTTTHDQVEEWIQASAAHEAQTASASGQQSGSGRHSTPKRKHPGSQSSSSSGQRSSSSRKRRAQGSGSAAPVPVATPPETKYVELRCFQMKTLQHCFPMGSAQDLTLRSRLEHIMDMLLRNELALAFSAPVNVNDVPGYADLIRNPIDLGTIKFRLSRGFYDQRFELLVHDVNLVWEICFTFNRLDADISNSKPLCLMAATAKASSALLSTRPQTYSDDNSSDSDSVAMDSSADVVDVDMEDLDLAARAPRSGFSVELLQQADGVQQALFGFGCVLTGGILAVLASWKPKWKVKMLRSPAQGTMDATSVLVAHTLTWTTNKKKKKMKRFYEECPLSQPVDSPPWFEFRKCRYVVDERESLGFSRLDNALDEKLGSAQRRCLEGSGWSTSQVEGLTGVHGANELALKAQTWPAVLLRKVAHPFYVFQVVSGLVWLCEGYEAYATVILVLSALSIVWEVHELVTNDKKLHTRLAHAEHSIANGVRVIRDSREKRVSPADLVVGDVVVIDEGVLPADIALLSGHCMADEATLTGEAIPMTKQALTAPDPSFAVNTKLKTTHRESVLFAGSTVLELAHSSSTQGNRDESKASTRGIVLSAGFSTSKGELFRSILFPTPLQLTKRLESDSYRFMGALSILAFILFVVRINSAIHDQGVSFGRAFLSAFDLVTIAVPPALPVVLTAGVGFALSRLESQADVACIDAARMNIAGHIDCFCFDKTGTLSSDHLDFHGVEVLSPPAIIGLATCHGLTERSGQIQGYALEKDMFRATGYSLEPETSDNTVMPGQFAALVASPIGKLFGVVARFPFDAARQRSSVVVEDLDSGNRYVYVKGSPEAIRKICTPNTLPSNYVARARSYAHQGFYVVALATKTFAAAAVSPRSETSQPVDRDAVESSAGFLGFMLFVNQVKPEAPYVVGALEEAGVDVRMITGDDALTAIHVARKINMDMESSVLLIDAQRQHESDEEVAVVYTDVDELLRALEKEVPAARKALGRLSIAVTGAAIEQLLASPSVEEDKPTDTSPAAPPTMSLTDFAEELVGRTKVFARVRPHQKTWIVETLMTHHGACVAMCGDGANDCGALKAAHVGLALSKDDAALVAPFTSRSLRVSDAVELLREGRGALSAAFVAFRYMVVYSVVQVTLSATMNGLHSQMSDSQFLFDDLVVVFVLSLLMVRTPQLHNSAPPRTLFAAEILLSLLGQLSIFLGCVYIALAAAEARPWFCSAQKALELTRAASDGGESDPDVVQVPCYVFVPGEPADLTSHSYENSVLWRFGHLQYWIAAVALNARDNYRAPLLRSNRSFVAYAFVLLIILLVQLLGDNGNLGDEETSTSAAVAKALKSRGVDVTLGALELPVGFAWSLFSLFLFDAGCVLCWEILVVGMVLPRFQMQHPGGIHRRKGKFGGWRSYFGISGDDKQSLVSPYVNERNGLLGDKPEGGKQVKVNRQSLQPIGARGNVDAVGSDDDEEQDVLDLHSPEIV
ncbi:P-type ATPase, cytoplasmic domain N [Phytophthora cactorum]|nr:P-type ATPase, cytoplasmic domain N [Phytophthora cactorum]